MDGNEDTVEPSLAAEDITPIAYVPNLISLPSPDSYPVWYSWLGQAMYLASLLLGQIGSLNIHSYTEIVIYLE